MSKLFLPLLTLALALSASANAFDFSQADALFKQRENNATAIGQARALYQDGLNSQSKDEKAYAAQQLGRLAYYEGELLTAEDSHSKRVEIFSQCMDDMDKAGPSIIGDTAQHFYWKTVCMALWGRSASKLSVLWRLSELKELMKHGLEVDSNYEGGGMHRVVATIKVRTKSMSWLPGGLYDLQGALTHIDQAIAKGPNFYNAYVVKAEILKNLGRDDEALALLEKTKRELEAKVRGSRLPEGFEPESRAFLKQIRNALLN